MWNACELDPDNSNANNNHHDPTLRRLTVSRITCPVTGLPPVADSASSSGGLHYRTTRITNIWLSPLKSVVLGGGGWLTEAPFNSQRHFLLFLSSSISYSIPFHYGHQWVMACYLHRAAQPCRKKLYSQCPCTLSKRVNSLVWTHLAVFLAIFSKNHQIHFLRGTDGSILTAMGYTFKPVDRVAINFSELVDTPKHGFIWLVLLIWR